MQRNSLILALTLTAAMQSIAYSQTQDVKTKTTPVQPQPTILDERIYRTGRAEKTLVLPANLPPEAPIPEAGVKLNGGANAQTVTIKAGAGAKSAASSHANSDAAEAPRDTNMFQLKPTILDEKYYRSGKAEHSLQLPGVLPPGAPIPDSF